MRLKTEAKRLAILEAAAAEFSKRGFHETTLTHVAERMGSSKATIYNYFRTKGELLGATLAAASIPATVALLEAFEGTAPFPARLQAFARAYLRLRTGDMAIALQRLLIAETDRSDQVIRPFLDDPDIHAPPHLVRIFRREQEQGNLRAGDCEEMARHLETLMCGDILLRLLFGERTSFADEEKDAAADSAVRFFLAACGAE